MLILPGRTASWSAAPAGFSVSYIGSDQVSLSGGTSFTFSGKTLGTGEIWVSVDFVNLSDTLTGVTVAGGAASIATDGVTSASAGATTTFSEIWYASSTSASGDIVLTFSSSEAWAGARISWYLVQNRTSIDEVISVSVSSSSSPTQVMVMDIGTITDGAVIACGNSDATSGPWTAFTGVTENAQSNYQGSMRAFGASATGATLETRTVRATANVTSATRITAVAVAIS